MFCEWPANSLAGQGQLGRAEAQASQTRARKRKNAHCHQYHHYQYILPIPSPLPWKAKAMQFHLPQWREAFQNPKCSWRAHFWSSRNQEDAHGFVWATINKGKRGKEFCPLGILGSVCYDKMILLGAPHVSYKCWNICWVCWAYIPPAAPTVEP